MVICHCNIVNDQRIKELVASGQSTVPEIGAQCGAGRTCGGCIPAIEDLLVQVTPSA